MTRILGEYTTLAGEPRRLVAVRRTGPSGWCLLDVPVHADAPADDFQIVRRLGDPSTFASIAQGWIGRASVSPGGQRWFEWWLADEAQRSSLVMRSTVDIYNDLNGMRRLVLVEGPAGATCSHLVDLAVAPAGGPSRLVATDLYTFSGGLEFAAPYVERELLRVAACRTRQL